MRRRLPLVLMILDGWGYSELKIHNAIASAYKPQWDDWWLNQPHTLLEAAGTCVGLPVGQMGNSEVGHMHIGAGRIIQQDFTRINDAIKTGEYAKNIVFIKEIAALKHTGKSMHVLGLLSAGGVHSHEEHLFAFLALCAEQQFKAVYLHLFLDGRDTAPQSALLSLERLQAQLCKYPVATIASISGRYYAMDRDKRWARLEPVYRLLTENHSAYRFKTPKAAIDSFYAEQIYDEFIPPSVIGSGAAIDDGDSIFFFNFRADRARQLTEAFVSPAFHGFKQNIRPKLSNFISMTMYAKDFATDSAYPPMSIKNTLGELVAQHGLRQLRIGETEKYAHITFFLNGGLEQVFCNEDRVLIPSPKVATYDLQPEMSAPLLTKSIIKAIASMKYDLIICNYANADMVGHSGNFLATIRAIEYLDQAMHELWRALDLKGGSLLITSDHGNAERMFDENTGQAHTAHTSQPVPLLYIGGGWHFNTGAASLIDIAPTVLALLNIKPPPEMTGHNLLVADD